MDPERRLILLEGAVYTRLERRADWLGVSLDQLVEQLIEFIMSSEVTW